MRKIILVSMVALFAIASFGMEFTLPIHAHCGVDDSTSTIGIDMDATNDFDSFDFPDIGFPPSFTLSFIHPGGVVSSFIMDIRSALDSVQIWDGSLMNPGDVEITLTWEPPSFPDDSAELFIRHHTYSDTDTVWVDMTTTDSITFPTGEMVQILFRQTLTPIEDTLPPEILDYSIAENETIADPLAPLSVVVIDTGSGVNVGSLSFVLNGIDLSMMVASYVSGDTAVFTYTPALPYVFADTLIFSVADYNSNTVVDTHHFYWATPDTGDTTIDSLNTVTCIVMLSDMAPDLSGSMVEILDLSLSEFTDISGQCVFDSIEDGTYTFKASRDGYFAADSIVDIDSSIILMFVLQPYDSGAFDVSGTVTLEGISGDLSGSIVTAQGIDTSATVVDTTDIDGYYDLELPLFGLYLITVTHDDFIPDSAYEMFFADTTVDFHLMPTDYIYDGKNENNTLQLSTMALGNSTHIFARNAQNISVFDVLGKIVKDYNVGNICDITIDSDEFPSGVYYIRATAENNAKTIKISITH
ncbi:T9SS type A sorting domain-containing protein [bacterium]|nr:T9SS type A sorting domain-containing protein [bacterium]